MEVPEGLRYTEDHEWVLARDDGTLRVGITDYAQDALGDVVFVELPDVDAEFAAGATVCEVESTKSVAEVYAPVPGRVVAVNERLRDEPELVNADPYGDGWFYDLAPAPDAGLDRLLDAAGYTAATA